MSHLEQQIAFGPTTTVFLDDPAGVGASSNRWTYDPLDVDEVDDEIIVTSSRRLTRVVVAAADAGARFALEAPDQDAATWMLAPRAVFDGRPAIEACQDLHGFTRSVVLHGLRLGLDADPAEIDDLIADDVFNPDCEGEDLDEVGSVAVDPVEVRLPRPLLLTSWIDCDDGSGRIFAFCGMVTDRPVDLVDRIIGRYGAVAAANADFQVGFDRSTAMATAMVSDAMAHVLAVAAEDPTSPLARGLDVSVEQRFAA